MPTDTSVRRPRPSGGGRRSARRCKCGRALRRYWSYCPDCDRRLTWADENGVTGADCYDCGWVVSERFSYCPWCGADIYEEDVSSEEPLRAPRGFRFDERCDRGCGGGVQYPMAYCPWCAGEQAWDWENRFDAKQKHYLATAYGPHAYGLSLLLSVPNHFQDLGLVSDLSPDVFRTHPSDGPTCIQ